MKNKQEEPQWISTTKAAELLGVSRKTVFKRIQSKLIKADKVGRNYIIATDEINRLLGKRGPLTEAEKTRIDAAIQRAVEQYGTALRLLGKE